MSMEQFGGMAGALFLVLVLIGIIYFVMVYVIIGPCLGLDFWGCVREGLLRIRGS